MKKYRVGLKNNSWLPFDEETGEIKLPEHFGVDLMYNNDLSKEKKEIKTGTIWNKEQLEIIKGLAIEYDMQIKDVLFQVVQVGLNNLSQANLKKAKDNMIINSFNRVKKESKNLFKE